MSNERIEQGEQRPQRPWLRRIGRYLRAAMIGNLVLAGLIVVSAVMAHAWASRGEDRLELSIDYATKYVLAPASLIVDHHVPPAMLDRLVGLIEALVIGSIDYAPEREAHRFFQGRVLMAMPTVYRQLGRSSDVLDRGERAIATFEALARRNPEFVDYRRRLAVSHEFHAADLAHLGRHEEAIRHWQLQYDIASSLLGQQPDYWRWRWYHAMADIGAGTSLLTLGRRAEAIPRLRAAQADARRLCEEFPGEALKCNIEKDAAIMLAVLGAE